MSESDHQPDRDAAEAARGGEGDFSLFGDAHIEAYEASDGEVGHIWNGAPCLVLTTTGERTGETRKHVLIYGQDDDAVAVVASKGGADDHPQWYKNLSAEPHVRVQVRSDRYDGIARTASAGEKAHWWPKMTALWPAYDDYQASTDRDIPVVVIDRAPSST